MVQRSLVASSILLFLLALGCSDGGVERHNLTGMVTFAGKPVPYGMIAFRPDRSKGGTGPAGFARIADGEYSTSSTGKGSVSGPIEVAIEGFESDRPYAPALFAPYKTATEISDDVAELDFTVPEGESPKWFRTGNSNEKRDL